MLGVISEAAQIWKPVDRFSENNGKYSIYIRAVAATSLAAVLAIRAFKSFTQPVISEQTMNQILIRHGEDYIRFGAQLLGMPLKWSLTIISAVALGVLCYCNEVNRRDTAFYSKLAETPFNQQTPQIKDLLATNDLALQVFIKAHPNDLEEIFRDLLPRILKSTQDAFKAYKVLIDALAVSNKKISPIQFIEILKNNNPEFAHALPEKCIDHKTLDPVACWDAVATDGAAEVLSAFKIDINKTNEEGKSALSKELGEWLPKPSKIDRLLHFGAMPSEDDLQKHPDIQGLAQAISRKDKSIAHLNTKSSVFSLQPAVTMNNTRFEWDDTTSFGRALISAILITPATFLAMDKLHSKGFLVCLATALVGLGVLPTCYFLFERSRANALLTKTALDEIKDKRFPNRYAVKYLKDRQIAYDKQSVVVDDHRL